MRDSVFIIADKNGNAYWSDVPSNSSSKWSISEEVLITFVEYLIDNIYVIQALYRNSNRNRLCAIGGKFVSILI